MTCQHCAKPIYWSVAQRLWFHTGNLMTWCSDAWGRTKAVPSDLELD